MLGHVWWHVRIHGPHHWNDPMSGISAAQHGISGLHRPENARIEVMRLTTLPCDWDMPFACILQLLLPCIMIRYQILCASGAIIEAIVIRLQDKAIKSRVLFAHAIWAITSNLPLSAFLEMFHDTPKITVLANTIAHLGNSPETIIFTYNIWP